MSYVMGFRRRGEGVGNREVSILAELGTFTGYQRILRYLGFQLYRATVLVTMSTVAENSLESHCVAGRPSRIANW